MSFDQQTVKILGMIFPRSDSRQKIAQELLLFDHYPNSDEVSEVSTRHNLTQSSGFKNPQ